jgi:hypothetical protein
MFFVIGPAWFVLVVLLFHFANRRHSRPPLPPLPRVQDRFAYQLRDIRDGTYYGARILPPEVAEEQNNKLAREGSDFRWSLVP